MARGDGSKLQAADMRFLERSKRVQDKVLGVETTEKALNYREKCQLRKERTQHERIPKQITKYQPRGSKSIGRPREKMDEIVRPEQV
jgi:hypothetical protein